jgi:hypothetical protein
MFVVFDWSEKKLTVCCEWYPVYLKLNYIDVLLKMVSSASYHKILESYELKTSRVTKETGTGISQDRP